MMVRASQMPPDVTTASTTAAAAVVVVVLLMEVAVVAGCVEVVVTPVSSAWASTTEPSARIKAHAYDVARTMVVRGHGLGRP